MPKAPAHRDLEIQEIAYDSRKVKPGTLSFIRGEKTDGNNFIADASLASNPQSPANSRFPQPCGGFPVDSGANARKSLAITAANYFGRPADVLKLVGITGTNGKTTTAI